MISIRAFLQKLATFVKIFLACDCRCGMYGCCSMRSNPKRAYRSWEAIDVSDGLSIAEVSFMQPSKLTYLRKLVMNRWPVGGDTDRSRMMSLEEY